MIGLLGLARAESDSTADAAIERRLAETDRYLSSDELEGRGLGAKGLDLAADFIARQFHQVGLRTDLFGGSPFQTFKVTTAIAMGPDNRLALVGPPDRPGGPPRRFELVLNRDFTPTVDSSSGKFDLPLVFVGYGITAKPEGYDDFAGVQVAGKAVLLLRHEPQQADPESVFNGIRDSEYSFLRRKIATAYEHGAAVVVACTDLFAIRNHQRGDDTLLRYHRGPISHVPCDIPVVHVRRAVMDQAVRGGLGTDLAALEAKIDLGPTPHSGPLVGWRIAGRVDIRRTEHEVKNVLGVLDGEGPTADETIIVGAHYDHLGCTESGDPQPPGQGDLPRRRRQRLGRGGDDRDRPLAGHSAGRRQLHAGAPARGTAGCTAGCCSSPLRARRRGTWAANTMSLTRDSPWPGLRPCSTSTCSAGCVTTR